MLYEVITGMRGGEVVFSGTPDDMLTDEHSLTGQYFSGRKQIEIPEARRPGNGKRLIVRGAAENNLNRVNAEFPLGCLVCVTGVSGSGKSTLVLETLYRTLSQKINHTRLIPGVHEVVSGLDRITSYNVCYTKLLRSRTYKPETCYRERWLSRIFSGIPLHPAAGSANQR